MHPKQILRSAAICILAAAMLCPAVSAESLKSSDVVSAALGEVGSTEGADEYSKYGEWYGLPNDYWCDMFVSWCAMEAGIPVSVFPWQCSCTKHVKLFTEMGRYQPSAARGGSYTPQQGDVIFFYNYLQSPAGNVSHHTGLVLYTEDGWVYTIEGNALTNRLDLSYAEMAEWRDGTQEPLDYVCVNRYALTDPHIHGYGVPDYDERTPLELTGFVDLGRYEESAPVFQALCDAGLMYPTSSHTFSPLHGMTRGEFLTLVTDFFGLRSYDWTTPSFDDVSPDSDYYAAAMSARSAGLVHGAQDNCLLPDRYISPSDAQAILSRAMAYVGLEEQAFFFSEGDYSYILNTYTTRADIAFAFDALCRQFPLSEPFDGLISLDGDALAWSARSLNGVCYVPTAFLQEAFPALEVLTEETACSTDSDRVFPAIITLQYGGIAIGADGFVCRGTPYVALWAAADLLGVSMEQTGEDGRTIALTAR